MYSVQATQTKVVFFHPLDLATASLPRRGRAAGQVFPLVLKVRSFGSHLGGLGWSREERESRKEEELGVGARGEEREFGSSRLEKPRKCEANFYLHGGKKGRKEMTRCGKKSGRTNAPLK